MPKKAPEEPKPLSFATPNPWSALPREVHVSTGHGKKVKPVRTPVAILGSLGVCIYVPASRHWLISYSPIHLN